MPQKITLLQVKLQNKSHFKIQGGASWNNKENNRAPSPKL